MTLLIFLEMKTSSAWPWRSLPEELGRKVSSEGSGARDLANSSRQRVRWH